METIKNLNCKKHVKIYKMKQLGMSNKDIAKELCTNVGHVYNVLKKYKENIELVNKANGINS